MHKFFLVSQLTYTLMRPGFGRWPTLIDIEYSATGNPNEIEFECARVSPANEYSEEITNELDKLLESGVELEIVRLLEDIYKGTGVTFVHSSSI